MCEEHKLLLSRMVLYLDVEEKCEKVTDSQELGMRHTDTLVSCSSSFSRLRPHAQHQALLMQFVTIIKETPLPETLATFTITPAFFSRVSSTIVTFLLTAAAT